MLTKNKICFRVICNFYFKNTLLKVAFQSFVTCLLHINVIHFYEIIYFREMI